MTGLFTPPTTVVDYTLARGRHVNDLSNATEAFDNTLPTEREIKESRVTYGTGGGTANAQTVTLPYPPASYTDGMEVIYKPTVANTASATLNVNSLGAVTVKRVDGNTLSAGDFEVGRTAVLRYSSTGPEFYLTNPCASFAVTDGTASIVYGANWSNLGWTQVKKTGGKVVAVSVSVTATGAVADTAITLPSGFRPPTDVTGISGIYQDNIGLQYLQAFASVLSDGKVKVWPISGGALGSKANGDAVFLNFTFFTS